MTPVKFASAEDVADGMMVAHTNDDGSVWAITADPGGIETEIWAGVPRPELAES